jgi:hypothetical protein
VAQASGLQRRPPGRRGIALSHHQSTDTTIESKNKKFRSGRRVRTSTRKFSKFANPVYLCS